MTTLSDQIDPPPADGNKSEWRRYLLRRRQMMLAAERDLAERTIADLLSAHAIHDNWDRVGVFLPWKGEPDLMGLWRAWHARGMHLMLPVVTQREGPMVFRSWKPGAAMLQDLMGLPVPEAGHEAVPEVWVLPCIGIDPAGARLGAGKGYYDRTLAAVMAQPGHVPARRPRLVGVSFGFAEIDRRIGEPHDLCCDAWVSERGWRSPGRS